MASKKALQLEIEALQSKVDNLELVITESFDDIQKDMDKLSSAKSLVSPSKKRQAEEHKQITQPMVTRCSSVLFLVILILLVVDIATHFIL